MDGIAVQHEKHPSFSDFKIFNPFEKVTPKSSNRRKTISSVFEENLEDTNTPHTSDQTSFKRKSVSSVNAAPSPKRLRSGKRNSVAAVTKVKEEPVNNSLECDSSAVEDNYTQWVLLQDLGSKISTKPGVYELKVWRAKKSAFIGSCENLHQKLELHKLGQNSGHKHLDKFLERNKNDVLVRYEEMPSFMVAKAEEKKRVESFITLHKTTPAYN
ncbi:uncharacterized protein LOC118180297 [Stegodyphus dumicola]|uniref:uncharacterized protein LOC118180297 n=1 Tax=Stegodyphus dumicola TaxID=202533 RepID=UPI0015A85EF8|nr:uncharacterized protein LOC118180297 [Stegodyphus dumicola]